MRVAVTGASGFIGRKVVEHLKEKGHKVISVGRTDPKIKNVEHRTWGLYKKINAIVHCAADTSDWTKTPEDEQLLKDTNVQLTHQAIAINPDARFILMSSASVYATLDKEFICHEEIVPSDTVMMNVYGISKAMSEHVVDQNKKEGKYYILRPRAVYGKGDTTLLPRVISYANGHFILPGKNPMGSFTNIKTLCEVVEFFVNDIHEENCGIYNVADGQPENMHQVIIDFLGKRGKKNAKPILLPYKMAFASALALENRAKKKGEEPAASRYLVSQIGRESIMDITKLEHTMGRKLPLLNLDGAEDW